MTGLARTLAVANQKREPSAGTLLRMRTSRARITARKRVDPQLTRTFHGVVSPIGNFLRQELRDSGYVAGVLKI